MGFGEQSINDWILQAQISFPYRNGMGFLLAVFSILAQQLNDVIRAKYFIVQAIDPF